MSNLALVIRLSTIFLFLLYLTELMFSFLDPQSRHVNVLSKSRSSLCIIKSSPKFEFVVTKVFDDMINLKTFAFAFPAMDLKEP